MSEWERTQSSWASSIPLDRKWNIFSRSFLFFMLPLLWRGLRKNHFGPLEREDLPGLPSYLKFSHVTFDIDQAWNIELERPQPRLYRVLFTTCRSLLCWGSLCSFVQGLLSAVGRPLILRSLVVGLQSGTWDYSQAVLFIFIFGLISFLEGWIGVLGRQLLAEQFATKFQQSVSSLILAKSSKIDRGPSVAEESPSRNKKKPSWWRSWNRRRRRHRQQQQVDINHQNENAGFMVASETTLLGNDLTRSYENLRASSQLPMSFAAVIGGVTVLLLEVGTSALTGLFIMVLILLTNMVLSRVGFGVEKRNLSLADERLTILRSILESVRAVKLFGWETKFLDRAEQVRARELVGIAKYRLIQVTNVVLGRASPVLSSMVTLVVFAFSGGELNMANAFVTVSVFQSLRLALIIIPLASQTLMAVFASLGRMEKYLLAKELKPTVHLAQSNILLTMDHVTLQCNPSFPSQLEDISLHVEPGSILAVCGSVGAGKTTLIRGAAQLLLPFQGSVSSVSHVGYMPQRALLIGGTLQDNILMGRSLDLERLREAIERSQFKRDVSLLPGGLLAEIGERGTTLSGGQMQRLSLCRALYSNPPLLLLDDPFSAVDAKVCRQMFNALVALSHHAKERTGIFLVLNQINLLPECDRVLFLHERRVHLTGTFQECVQQKDAVFSRFVETLTLEEEVAEGEAIDPVYNNTPEEEDEETTKKETATIEQSILSIERGTRGAVSTRVYWTYLLAFSRRLAVCCTILVCVGYALMVVNDFWLSTWANAERNRTESTPPSSYYATVFALLSCGFAILILFGSFLLVLGGVQASKKLHAESLSKVVHAPLFWFESGTSGRILSRFSGDLSRVDLNLSYTIDNAFQLIVQLLATMVTVCVIVSYWLFFLACLAVVVFALLLVAVDRTLREAKRLSNAAMSPVLSNMSEAIQAFEHVSRAFGPHEESDFHAFFQRRHTVAMDEYARANLTSGTLLNFAFLCSHMIAFVLALTSASLIVFLQDQYDASLLGLALTYALVIPYLSSMAALSLTNMNMSFTSLERLLEYEQIPQEPVQTLESDPPPSVWPSLGAICFRQVNARYRNGLPLCLTQVSFDIQSGESVGIVGRTGSGKSSIVACLFRLIDVVGGSISIDGVDIATVGLAALRSRMTIIPQEPVLMSGTVRYNLDPFEEHTDDVLSNCLIQVGLVSMKLTDSVDLQGGNLSAGERQLLCFARALVLKNNRIIVMDEPSSALDMQTDAAISKLVQLELRIKRQCTILTVAHRMETVIQADKILVMRDGQVVEFDAPNVLLSQPNSSEFYSMVAALGSNASSRLMLMANPSTQRRQQQDTLEV